MSLTRMVLAAIAVYVAAAAYVFVESYFAPPAIGPSPKRRDGVGCA